MKKILIDAKWLYEGPVSGKVVVENILKQLAEEYINKYQIIVLLDARDNKNEQYYSKLGFQTISVWGRINLLSNLFLIPFKLRNSDIDMGIFQNYIPLFSSFKNIVYIHDIIYESHPQYFTFLEKLYFKPVRYCARKSDVIITVSENEKRRLIKYNYGNNDKISVIYNGVNRLNEVNNEMSEDGASSVNNLPEEFVLYVGRLNDRKNIYNLIKSFEYVHDSLSLVIVGKKDWKNNKLKRILKSDRISKKIQFTGYLSDINLTRVFRRASIFAYVSFEEGFGLPPLEAMSFGLPVVVSSVSCIPEVCGEAGIYVDPNNPKDIAQGINKLHENKNLRESKIKIGYKQVEKFTWEKSVENLTNLIDSIEV